MDAPERSVTPADRAELQRLRSRAYGPDADISRDPAAQARLSDLEAAMGGRGIGAGVGDSQADAEDRSADAAGRRARTEAEEPPVPADTAEGPPRAPRPLWRLPAVWVVGGFVLLASVGAIAALPALLPGAPDHTLGVRASGDDIPMADRQELNTHAMISYLGLKADELRLFEDFRGVNIWSAPTEYGTTCLFITTRSQGMWATSCAPPEIDPEIRLNQYEHELLHRDDQDPWLGMPWGSLIRLRLQGDAVLVWDYPAP